MKSNRPFLTVGFLFIYFSTLFLVLLGEAFLAMVVLSTFLVFLVIAAPVNPSGGEATLNEKEEFPELDEDHEDDDPTVDEDELEEE